MVVPCGCMVCISRRGMRGRCLAVARRGMCGCCPHCPRITGEGYVGCCLVVAVLVVLTLGQCSVLGWGGGGALAMGHVCMHCVCHGCEWNPPSIAGALRGLRPIHCVCHASFVASAARGAHPVYVRCVCHTPCVRALRVSYTRVPIHAFAMHVYHSRVPTHACTIHTYHTRVCHILPSVGPFIACTHTAGYHPPWATRHNPFSRRLSLRVPRTRHGGISHASTVYAPSARLTSSCACAGSFVFFGSA